MSSAKSGSEFLAARDRRQALLSSRLREGGAPESALLFLSLNIPGPRKRRRGAGALFAWALSALQEAFGAPAGLAIRRDILGPCAAMRVAAPPAEAKRLCVRIEASRPFARLVDLDVYDGDGRQVDRRSLGLPPRSCLLCSEPASDCIRLGRHSAGELDRLVDELLASLSHPAVR